MPLKSNNVHGNVWDTCNAKYVQPACLPKTWLQWIHVHMMTSSNGNIFHVTGPLCGEFTVHRWIPLTKASDVEFWCFLWSAPNKCLSKQSWGWWFGTPLCHSWRHCDDFIWYVLMQFETKCYINRSLIIKHILLTREHKLLPINSATNYYRSKWNSFQTNSWKNFLGKITTL